MAKFEIHCGDCLDVMRTMPSRSVDLVFCSPPYEAARTYGIGFKLKGQDWVDWAVERFVECHRICNGLVAWVVEGQTRAFNWSATPALLMADLKRRGIKLRKPPVFNRVGICGSGGPDWLRNDWEFIVCASHGRLPWSNNVAMGQKCRYGVGGAMSNRTEDGRRRNKRTGSRLERMAKERKAVKFLEDGGTPGEKLHTKNNGDGMRVQCYTPPTLANPGNVIRCTVGGGRMGSKLAHENEAAFPESLAEFFVRSFCPPGGKVLDCFSGSGTTGAVALKTGRRYIGIDVRESQVELTKRRLAEVQPELIAV